MSEDIFDDIGESQVLDGDDEIGRQKRENVRVDIRLPLILRMHGRELPARTRDLSATGVGFSTRLPVQLDERAEVEISFKDWVFSKQVVIKFVRPMLAGSTVGAQFDELSEDEREQLIKVIFDLQREILRSGSRNAT